MTSRFLVRCNANKVSKNQSSSGDVIAEIAVVNKTRVARQNDPRQSGYRSVSLSNRLPAVAGLGWLGKGPFKSHEMS